MVSVQLKTPCREFCFTRVSRHTSQLFDCPGPTRSERIYLPQSELPPSTVPFRAKIFQLNRLVEPRDLQLPLSNVGPPVPCGLRIRTPFPPQIGVHFSPQFPTTLQLPTKRSGNGH